MSLVSFVALFPYPRVYSALSVTVISRNQHDDIAAPIGDTQTFIIDDESEAASAA